MHVLLDHCGMRVGFGHVQPLIFLTGPHGMLKCHAFVASFPIYFLLLDALQSIKDSGDLPETTIGEAAACYNQLLLHLCEVEVYVSCAKTCSMTYPLPETQPLFTA